MKNLKTVKILINVCIVIAAMLLVNLSFLLMNQASTILFIVGLLLFIASAGGTIEYFVVKNKKK